MFEIPEQCAGLMNEYEELVKRSIKKKNSFLKKEWIDHLNPITEEDLRERIENEYEAEIWFNSFEDESICSFVEERIGEDFVVFEGYEDELFCLHEIEDFISKAKINWEVSIDRENKA